MNFLAFVPLPYKLLALGLLVLALFGTGWVKGANYVHGQWEAATAAEALRQAKVAAKQAEATVKVQTKYIDRVRVVREKGDTIIKEVPVYVTPEADARCIVNAGFVRLHDAAAKNEVSEPASGVNETPSGVALSTVAATVGENYKRCHQNAEQLIHLQEWVTEQAKVTAED